MSTTVSEALGGYSVALGGHMASNLIQPSLTEHYVASVVYIVSFIPQGLSVVHDLMAVNHLLSSYQSKTREIMCSIHLTVYLQSLQSKVFVAVSVFI